MGISIRHAYWPSKSSGLLHVRVLGALVVPTPETALVAICDSRIALGRGVEFHFDNEPNICQRCQRGRPKRLQERLWD